MGIRMLHRRTAPARSQAQVKAGAGPSRPRLTIQVFAADASTARIPTDLATTLRRTATVLRRRLARRIRTAIQPGGAPGRRRWLDLGRSVRSYLARVLTLLPRSRGAHSRPVRVAPPASFSERPDGAAPCRPSPDDRGPRPDATP
jgi:hypothetical protein